MDVAVAFFILFPRQEIGVYLAEYQMVFFSFKYYLTGTTCYKDSLKVVGRDRAEDMWDVRSIPGNHVHTESEVESKASVSMNSMKDVVNRPDR